MSCTERKATGMCGGRLVLIDRTKLSASCCDTCGAYGYTHLSMAQLLKHMHRLLVLSTAKTLLDTQSCTMLVLYKKIVYQNITDVFQ